jgi:hypothetical protein
MSEKPISPLRRRMIEDMTVRNFVEKTRNEYIRHVRAFTAFLGRSPDTARPEDLRRFQLHQTQTGVHPPSINGSVAALRFFFTVTLDRPEIARHLTFVREPRKMPAVLSPGEVARLLEAAPGPKYKAALSAAYAAALKRVRAHFGRSAHRRVRLLHAQAPLYLPHGPLPSRTGDPILCLRLDGTAPVREVAPYFLSHGAAYLLRQCGECLASGTPTALEGTVIGIE